MDYILGKEHVIDMSESYKELMVKREIGFREILTRAVCIVPTALLAALTLLTGNMVPFIATVLLGVLVYFVFQWTDIEYEYLYLDKEITVDKVMAKTRRKRAVVIDVNKIEILAPENSDHLSYYKNRQVKLTDLSAGHDIPGQRLYLLYYERNQAFLLNLDDDFAKLVKSAAPRKVFIE